MPPAFLQSASVFAFVTSAAKAGPVKASAKAKANIETRVFMMFPPLRWTSPETINRGVRSGTTHFAASISPRSSSRSNPTPYKRRDRRAGGSKAYIRNDLQERADLAQDQIRAADAQFQRMVEQLRHEHDARIADLKGALDYDRQAHGI